MHQRNRAGWMACILALLISLPVTGCSAEESAKAGSSSSSVQSGGARSSSPVIHEPEAPQTAVLGTEELAVDISNTDQGYVMARYTGDADKVNIQITGPDGVDYKYFLAPSDSFIPLPLTCGDGPYDIDGYEHVADSQYAVLFRERVEVSLESQLLPFLYPSQYVNFNAGSAAVKAAQEAVTGASSDLDAVADIYHYVIGHVIYDDEKAENVTSGYLPDVDETLRTGKGICFDYASLTTAMLRSQNIPSRLEIGYSGDIYHAWISVYTEETGWIDGIIEFTADGWTRMDPTFAASDGNSEAVLEYIGDGSNYITLYSR